MLWSMALIFITSCIIGTIGFAVMPLGQKRLYEGKVELQLSGDVRLGFVGTRREENVQLREVAVEREAEGVRHIVFRKVRAKGWERGDAVQFVIAPPNTVSQLYHLPSGFPSLPYLPPHLVFAFQPSLRKVGQTWTRQESVWWGGLGGFNLPVRYRLVTVEKNQRSTLLGRGTGCAEAVGTCPNPRIFRTMVAVTKRRRDDEIHPEHEV
jgi:hypothetical protein